MSIMTFFSGSFCGKDQIIQTIIERSGFCLLSDQDLIQSASQLSGIPENKIARAFMNKASVFNKFTHEKERSIAYLRLAVAQSLSSDDYLIDGFSSMLIPESVTHVLRTCLISDMKNRIVQASREKQVSEKDAAAIVKSDDEQAAAWSNSLFKIKTPWNPSLYDIVIPTDQTDTEQIVSLSKYSSFMTRSGLSVRP